MYNNTPRATLLQLLAILPVLLYSTLSAAETSNSSAITIDKLMQLQQPSDLQLDPSGQWLAYVLKRYERKQDKSLQQIWMTSVDGKTTLPLTAEYTDASHPRWSPDGTTLAFLGKRGQADELKDAENQVWLLDRRGGEARQYTHVEQGVDAFEWAPDGSKMLLVLTDPKPKDKDAKQGDKEKSKPWVIDRLQFKQDYVGYLDRRRSHIYLFDGSNPPKQLTFGDYDDSEAQWSPDGKTIAFSSKRQGDPDANNNGDIWLVDVSTASKDSPLTQLTTNPGNDYRPVWSNNGQYIAYISEVSPEKLWYATEHLALIPAKGGQARLVTQSYDRHVSQAQFSPQDDALYFRAADRGNEPLMQVSLSSGKISPLVAGEAVIGEFTVLGKQQLAYFKSSHKQPYELFVQQGNRERQLSQFNQAAVANSQLAGVGRLQVKGYQGDLVDSFVYYPSGYNKAQAYPTLFYLHGGPVAQHDSSFNDIGQLFAANGYLVVMPNPHGSSGYGEAFSYSLYQQWGVPDFADVDAIATHLVDAGVSDASRLGVAGWSYGGILTNYVITKTTRFAAAMSGASEVNYTANYGHDIYQYFWEKELGLPWQQQAAWDAISPFYQLDKVRTPTLVMGGKEDWNVPIQNSEQLYQGLKRLGIDTQLVVYPDEFHGLSRPSFIQDRFQRYLDWFARYLKP